LYYTTGTETESASYTYSHASPAESLSSTIPAPPFLLANSTDEAIPLAQATYLAQQLNEQCSATGSKVSTQLAVLSGDQHAVTYSDIFSGPTLDFLTDAVDGTLPTGCTTLSPLTGASMAYDANQSAKSTILFGGCCTSAAALSGSTQVFDSTTASWAPVTITGTSPSPRLGAAFAYDPTSGDLVLFGGESLPGGSAQPVALDDTWELSYQSSTNTGTWSEVPTSTEPSARYAATADEAPHLQGLVLYGGENIPSAVEGGSPAADGDTWLWNGSWTELSTSRAPPVLYGANESYDGSNNTDVLFAGDETSSSCGASCLDLVGDTWVLSYNTTSGAWTWTEKSKSGPAAREFPAGSSDSTGTVIFGGMGGSGNGKTINSDDLLDDTWTWNGSDWTLCSSSCATSPPEEVGASLAYNRNTDEGLLYGGYTDTAPPSAPLVTWIWNGSWASS
ncbi:MAG TPA: kelch repeat-containing protein, partial [Acidimicrobiales bacterium]|nr:kelch repeat-containing protein [Acidimicrobiales bacterium]